MRRRILLGSLVLTLVIGVAACGDDSDSSSSTTTTATEPATTTTTAPATTTSTPPITAGGESVEQCAQTVYDAWMNDVEGAATLCATQQAVGQIFDRTYTEGEFDSAPQCGDPGAGQVQCTFAGDSENLVMQVSDGTGGRIVVESVTFESA